jgi:hypothetical protein
VTRAGIEVSHESGVAISREDTTRGWRNGDEEHDSVGAGPDLLRGTGGRAHRLFQRGEADAAPGTENDEDADMTLSNIAPTLTGERTMTKYTGGSERPSRDEIARLAYHIYETHGRREGHDVDDWLSAERELKHHYR